MICKPCQGNSVKDWPEENLPGLKYQLEHGDLCAVHAPEAQERLKSFKEEPKKYVLKPTTEAFLPPIIKAPKKDWTEREPNDGSLIE